MGKTSSSQRRLQTIAVQDSRHTHSAGKKLLARAATCQKDPGPPVERGGYRPDAVRAPAPTLLFGEGRGWLQLSDPDQRQYTRNTHRCLGKRDVRGGEGSTGYGCQNGGIPG